jgi:hypothetical protein
MKTKYFVIKYVKRKKSVLETLYEAGGFYDKTDMYNITLERHRLFGLLKDEIVKNVELPKDFNHSVELKTGREFIF